MQHQQHRPGRVAQLDPSPAFPAHAAPGHVRDWLSAGRAGFGLSPLECERPAFYCIVYSSKSELPLLQGWRVKTSPVAAKSGMFARLKSVDYLHNSLCLLDAQEEGFDQVAPGSQAALSGRAALPVGTGEWPVVRLHSRAVEQGAVPALGWGSCAMYVCGGGLWHQRWLHLG